MKNSKAVLDYKLFGLILVEKSWLSIFATTLLSIFVFFPKTFEIEDYIANLIINLDIQSKQFGRTEKKTWNYF